MIHLPEKMERDVVNRIDSRRQQNGERNRALRLIALSSSRTVPLKLIASKSDKC